MTRPPEYYVALATGVAIVYLRYMTEPLRRRLLISSISGGIGFSLSKEVAEYFNRSETIAVMLLTAIGFVVLEVLTDKKLLRSIILSRLGDGGRNDNAGLPPDEK